MRLSLIIFWFCIGVSWADSTPKELAGFDPLVDIISENYEAGPFLIYDCVEGHWVCVLESYYRTCESQRAEDQLAKKLDLRCAPIGEFPTKKSCFQRQLYLTGQNQGTRFCIGDEWKQKEVRF
jgi:hypothetical protein